ncbi:hypothetical protein J2X65_003148 [Ancylobacter sp. 3268]|nr:hypothetical protein [Ancylobacter sp. 3268]
MAFELSYPVDASPLSEIIANAMLNDWANTPVRDNDGTADSAITGVTASTGVITVAAGAAFAVGHLVRLSGFGVAANNGVFRITTGSATVPAVGAALLADEAAPAAAARMKVVGFAGAAGDITATATGLASTALDFTTLGLSVGRWIKIGGTAAGDRFATAVLNGWARIIAISANALTLDNLPAGWAIDAGAGKTLKVFVGDQVKNGVTRIAHTIEKGFLGQAVPAYICSYGLHANEFGISMTNRQIITGSVTFVGMGGALNSAPLDASPDAETDAAVMASHVNVGRIAEGGALVAAPNWARSLSYTINNNYGAVEDLQADAPVDARDGEATVTGTAEFYFGSDLLLQKFFAGTPTSINSIVRKNGQALITTLPRVTYNGNGTPQAGGKNQDVMQSFEFKASKDTLTQAHILMDRLEYFEA